MAMTYEQKIYSMTGAALIQEAEKLGVKVSKKGNSLKESKAAVRDRLIAAWEAQQTEVEEVAETEERVEVEEVKTEEPREEAEEPKQKKERKPRQKKEMAADAKALHDYVLATCEELGGIVYVPKTDIKFRGLKAGKHMFVKYHWGNNGVTLQVRAEAIGLDAPKNPANHTFNDKYRFTEDNTETRAEIRKLMEAAYNWQVAKNEARAKK